MASASALNDMIRGATVPEIINITTALSTRLGQIAGGSVMPAARAPALLPAAPLPAAARAPVVVAAKPASATSTINPFAPLPAAAKPASAAPLPASASADMNLQSLRGKSAILTDTNRRTIAADAAKARIQASAANAKRAAEAAKAAEAAFAAAKPAVGRATIERLGATIPKPSAASAALEKRIDTATKRAEATFGKIGNGQLGGRRRTVHQKHRNIIRRKTHKSHH